jgi:ankyrin repeat protein
MVAVLLVLSACSNGAEAPSDEGLREAAGRGDVAAVRAALDGGARPEAADSSGATALVRAAYSNQVEAATVLVEAGANVNHKDSSMQSPYLIATSEVGDDPRLLDLFAANGAVVNDKDSYNGTGLIRAAHRGYPVIIDRLVKAGVEVDHVNRLGWTALLEAVILGTGGDEHQAVVRRLLEAGADRSIADREGRTALDHARERGFTEIVALLE